MNYIQGIDRQQITAFPMTLEEFVSSENPVRFLDAFVNALSAQGCARQMPASLYILLYTLIVLLFTILLGEATKNPQRP